MKLHGRVVVGLGIGKELGYPTMNLACNSEMLPPSGVYPVDVVIDSLHYEGVSVIGARFEKGKPLVEVHVFDFNKDAYGKIVEVELHEKVSDVGKLDSHLLRKKIEADIRKVREWFSKRRRENT